jgi:hypothetical protein
LLDLFLDSLAASKPKWTEVALMATDLIPLTHAEIDDEFLTRVLRHTMQDINHGEVLGHVKEFIGEGAGFLGDIVRVRLEVDGNDKAPASMIFKIPAASDNSRLGQSLGVYEREIRFYSELQSLLNIRTPVHYFSDMGGATDPEQSVKAIKFLNGLPYWLLRPAFPVMTWLMGLRKIPYILAIEDLEGHRVGDQLGGCTLQDAHKALDTMADMHAQFWDSKTLDDYPWLIAIDMAGNLVQMMFLGSVDEFSTNHADELNATHLEQLSWLKDHFIELSDLLSAEPDTLIHGDFRLDNLCFNESNDEVILFDWQTTSRGPVGLDLAYFVSGTIVTDVDEDAVDQLLECYRKNLASRGVDLSVAQVRWHYETGIIFILHRMVFAETQQLLEMGEGRGVELLDTWIQRMLNRARNIDVTSLLTRPD